MAVSISIAIAQNSQSIANNTSNVTVTLKVSWTGGSHNLLVNASGVYQAKGWLSIDGTKYEFDKGFNFHKETTGTETLLTKTVTINHGSDGKKTLSCSASYATGVSSGTVTASASKTLTTIPRKSTLSVANGTLGTAQTLTVTRKSTSFTHTISYVCGAESGTVCTKSSSTSISFTPPIALASQNTTGTSVTIVYTITTYNGSTSLGSNSYTKTCAIPSSVKPSCTIAVSDATEYKDKFGAYVQGLSKFAVTVTPKLSYGSPIASYSIVANGSTYTKASFTTDVLKSAGTFYVSGYVKDKRGRTGLGTTPALIVLAYSRPAISNLTTQRCDEAGNSNANGAYIKVGFNAKITDLNGKNTASYLLEYKKASDSSYTQVDLPDYEGVFTVEGGSYIFEAPTSFSYNVRIVASDEVMNTVLATTAPTGAKFMSWRKGGRGLAFGKVAELDDTVEFGFDAKFNKPVYGNVVGLNKLPEILEGDDFNNYLETGCWAVYKNTIAATIANIPVPRAGRLEVWSATGEGIRLAQWSYLRQRFIPYNSDNAVWERDITRSEDNVWKYYDWYRTSLTPAASEFVYHEPKILWGDDLTSGMYMTAGHTADLKEAVSAQRHGIVLTFCAYNGTDDTNYGWQSFFVPKHLVALSSSGHTFELSRGKYTYKGTKYLYIGDTAITGHADNNLTGTANGITYANNKFVLRYVFGV